MNINNVVDEMVNEALRKGDVKSIKVEVGALAPFSVSAVENTLISLVDWHVYVVEKEAVVRCECGYYGAPKIVEKGEDFSLFVCPKCGEIPKIESGDKIKLVEVSLK